MAGAMKGHGAAGRGVEAEDLALAARGDDARQEGARRGLSGAHEDAQGQAQGPEPRWAAAWRKKTPKPATTMADSDRMMTFFGPILSSTQPKATVARPATILAAIAKIMTSPALKPRPSWPEPLRR